ncbi:MAG: twin-arginine translocation signal domain-containing protein [Gemmatimonadota bacterium]
MSQTSRRHFLAGLAGAGVALPVFNERAMSRLFEANVLAGDRPADALADDESYWMQIQKAFDADRTMINLNNGGISPTPSHVLEQMIRDLRFVNELPVEHNWRVLEPRMESTRRELAREFGCDPEEMAVTRNASEGLEIMILGLDLKRGVIAASRFRRRTFGSVSGTGKETCFTTIPSRRARCSQVLIIRP